jgi:hypothetical protein
MRWMVTLTMTERNQRPQSIENDRGADDPIHVQFAEELHGRDSALIVLEDVVLQGDDD